MNVADVPVDGANPINTGGEPHRMETGHRGGQGGPGPRMVLCGGLNVPDPPPTVLVRAWFKLGNSLGERGNDSWVHFTRKEEAG